MSNLKLRYVSDPTKSSSTHIPHSWQS